MAGISVHYSRVELLTLLGGEAGINQLKEARLLDTDRHMEPGPTHDMPACLSNTNLDSSKLLVPKLSCCHLSAQLTVVV